MASKIKQEYKPGPMVLLEILCSCRSFRYPHRLEAHRRLRSDWDWRSCEERERDTMQYWERGV